MRISDWSSDVCSSDLGTVVGPAERRLGNHHRRPVAVDDESDAGLVVAAQTGRAGRTQARLRAAHTAPARPPGRRVLRRHRARRGPARSEEHTSELQSLMRISYAVFCLKKKKKQHHTTQCNKLTTYM